MYSSTKLCAFVGLGALCSLGECQAKVQTKSVIHRVQTRSLEVAERLYCWTQALPEQIYTRGTNMLPVAKAVELLPWVESAMPWWEREELVELRRWMWRADRGAARAWRDSYWRANQFRGSAPIGYCAVQILLELDVSGSAASSRQTALSSILSSSAVNRDARRWS